MRDRLILLVLLALLVSACRAAPANTSASREAAPAARFPLTITGATGQEFT